MRTFEETVEFHGHACPGLALGYRVAAMAYAELGGRTADEEMVAVVENDSCAVDAIQAVLGCTFGKGSLIFRDYGKQVYTFIQRPSGDSLRVAVTWSPPPETGEDKTAWQMYSSGERSTEVVAAVHNRKARKIRAILEARDEELFKISRGRTEPPHEARIYPSLRCCMCGEKMMEPRARVRDGNIVCIPCFESGGESARSGEK